MSGGNGGRDGDDGRGGRLGEGITPLVATDPQRIASYLLLGRLGAGGMGRVYLARSEGGRTVAVKVVHEEHVRDEQFRARFRREINAARRVGAQYTAPVLDADPDADLPWVATGYVPGLSLEQVVRRFGPLPGASVRALGDGLLRALKDIHAAGIIHRDLKPSNVMITVKGPRVIDFGIARALETSVESLLTSTGLVIGSPGFMSPEQIQGRELGPASDVFSVGCVLAYAATGKLAFGHGATNPHAVNYHCVEGEPDLDRVPDGALRELIVRCLTKSSDERPGVDALLDQDSERPMATDGTWLPPDLVAHLAERAARLLDLDAAPRAEPVDRKTLDLAPRDAPDSPAAEPVAAEPVAAASVAGEPVAAGPAPVVTSAPEPRRSRRRTWFVAIPAVLVVAVGAGTAVVLHPWESDTRPPGASAAGDHPATTSSYLSNTPSASGRSSSPDAKNKKTKGPSSSKGTSAGSHASGAGGTSGGGASSSTGGGSATSSGGGSGSNSGSSSGKGGTGSTGGTSGSGGSGGTGGSGSTGGGHGISTSGTHRLRDVGNHLCLTASGTGSATCGSGSTLGWAFQSTGNGYQIVNKGSGQCLTDSFGYYGTADCGAPQTSELWALGPGTSAGRTVKNLSTGDCIAAHNAGASNMASCDPGDPNQLWYDY